MSRTRRIIAGCFCLVLVVAVAAAFNVLYGIDDAYAQWGVADMVIAYLEQHDGEWPPDWEALRAYYDAHGSRVSGQSFEQLQDRVRVDFSMNGVDLRAASVRSDDVPFQVIRARWTFGMQLGHGPNAMIHRYLRRKAGILEPSKPDRGWKSDRHKSLAYEWYLRGFFINVDANDRVIAAWTHLSEPGIPTDDDVQAFGKHPHVERLNLVADGLSDESLAVLRHLPNLKELDLGNGFSDAAVIHLLDHPSLSQLDVFGTEITDQGLRQLATLPSIKSIRFNADRISRETIDELRSLHPAIDMTTQGVLEFWPE